jgi:hypothetical protein
LLLLALVAFSTWIGITAWQEQRLTTAVGALPLDLQDATYRRVLDELSTTCVAEPERLEDHCRAQADFILKFPQCTRTCRDLAERFHRVRR